MMLKTAGVVKERPVRTKNKTRNVFFKSRNQNIVVYEIRSSDIIETQLESKKLFYVLQGELKIAVAGGTAWMLREDQYLLLPNGTEVRLQGGTGTQYIEIEAEKQVSPERELRVCTVYQFQRPEHKKEAVTRTILAGSHSVLMSMVFPAADAAPVQYSLPGLGFLFVTKGEGEVVCEMKKRSVKQGFKMRFAQGVSLGVKAKGAMRAVLLILLE